MYVSASTSLKLVIAGTGSPEGVVTRAVGTLYVQTDASPVSDALWIKQTGTGNTGWVQVSGTGIAETIFDALGDILYASAADTAAKLAGNTTTTKKFLTQTGNGAASAAPAWGTIAASDLGNNLRDVAVPFIIDGGGSAVTTGVKGYIEVPFSGTIVSNRLLADQSGSIVIDIWRDSYANAPPTVADTITAAAKPTLSAAQKSEDTSLTGWSTSVTAGDWLGFNVDSAATVQRVTLSLVIRRT